MQSNLDKLERLHTLFKTGALSDEEYQQEKARLLARRHTSSPVDQQPPSAEQPPIQPDRAFRYKATNATRLASFALIALLAGGAYWVVVAEPFRAFEESDHSTLEANPQKATGSTKLDNDGKDSGANTEVKPVAPSDEAEILEPESPYPGDEWFTKDSDEGFIAMYGPPQASWDYALECNSITQNIEFRSWGADSSSGDKVVADVAGSNPLRLGVRFSNDDTDTGKVAIPASSELFSALIAGETPFRITWSRGAVDEMPNTPTLRNFLRLCRQRVSN